MQAKGSGDWLTAFLDSTRQAGAGSFGGSDWLKIMTGSIASCNSILSVATMLC